MTRHDACSLVAMLSIEGKKVRGRTVYLTARWHVGEQATREEGCPSIGPQTTLDELSGSMPCTKMAFECEMLADRTKVERETGGRSGRGKPGVHRSLSRGRFESNYFVLMSWMDFCLCCRRREYRARRLWLRPAQRSIGKIQRFACTGQRH